MYTTSNITDRMIYSLVTIYFILVYCISGTVLPTRSLLLTCVSIGIFFIQIILNKGLIYTDKITKHIFIVYILGIVSSLLNNANTILFNILQMLQVLALYMGIVSFCNNEIKIVKIIKIIYWTGFIGGPLAGIYQMITNRYIYPLPSGSPYEGNTLMQTVISSALQQNSNLVALQFVATMFIGFFLYNRVKKKLLLKGSLFLCIIANILTFSRTTIIGIIMAGILYCIMNSRKIKLHKLIIIQFLIIVIPVLVYCNIETIITNILEFGDAKYVFKLKSSENVDIRFIQWIGIFKILVSSNIIEILFGYGENYVNVLGGITGYYITSHNTILEQLIKNGIVGCISLIYAFYYTIKMYIILYKRNKQYISLLLGLFVVLISLQMISSLSLDTVMYMMIASMYLRKIRGETSINEQKGKII